jgi:hypothetical protein
VDQRFHVPDGSKGPGDYGGPKMEENMGSLEALMWDEEVFECPSCSHRSSMRTSLVLPRDSRISSYNNSQSNIQAIRPQSQSGQPVTPSPLWQTHSLSHEAPLVPFSPLMSQSDWAELRIASSDVSYPQHPQALVVHGGAHQDDRAELIPPQRLSS